jgi:hypothetical protein
MPAGVPFRQKKNRVFEIGTWSWSVSLSSGKKADMTFITNWNFMITKTSAAFNLK